MHRLVHSLLLIVERVIQLAGCLREVIDQSVAFVEDMRESGDKRSDGVSLELRAETRRCLHDNGVLSGVPVRQSCMIFVSEWLWKRENYKLCCPVHLESVVRNSVVQLGMTNSARWAINGPSIVG